MHHAFLYITTSLHDYVVKMPYFTFCGGREPARQRLSSSFSELRYSLLEFNSRKNCQVLTSWMRENNSRGTKPPPLESKGHTETRQTMEISILIDVRLLFFLSHWVPYYPGPRGFSWFFFAKESKSKPRSGDNVISFVKKNQGKPLGPR